MALTNSQKNSILKTARSSGYIGDMTELFTQAESEGIFNTPEETVPTPNITKEDLNWANAEDYKVTPDSLLTDRTAHRFHNNENFITSSHTTDPNPRSIITFLNDPNYTPTAEPNMGADGGMKKYHEGGPNEGPHPDHHESGTEDFTQEELDAVLVPGDEGYVYDEGEEPPTRALEPMDEGEGTRITNTRLNTNIELQTGIGLKGGKVDGDWGEGSQAKMVEWSNNNLTNLTDYNSEWSKEDIVCGGSGCSGQTTSMLKQIFPHLSDDDLTADDSWYRRDHILRDGGEDIWSQNTDADWSEMSTIPPMDQWKNFRVGDIVHLNSSGDNNRVKDKVSAYTGTTEGNSRSEHTGFIIGRDPETGFPLIMHGAGGQMEVDAIDNITLGNYTGRDEDSALSDANYKIDGVSRPKGLKDAKEYNFNRLNMFLKQDAKDEFVQLGFEEEYLENLNKKDREMANLFQGFMNGNYKVKRDEEGAEVQEIDQEEIYRRLEYGSQRATNIQKMSDVTGYTEEEVAKAAMLTWGFYQNETGEVGLGSGAQYGKGMEFIKDSLSTKNAAKLKALSKGDITWSPTFFNPLGFDINEEEYMASAAAEPSTGIMRIKYNMQVRDADNEPTQVGKWFRRFGIRSAEDLTLEDDKENTLITGNPGRAGSANSFAAGTLLTISYYENIRRKKDYDPDTDTYKGIPIDYVVATMHKGLNLNQQAGDGNTILENLKKGNRGYSNTTINAANKLSYRVSPNPIEGVPYDADKGIIKDDVRPFTSSTSFMNSEK